MYKRILVPIDGSEHSLKALEVAKELGEKFQSEIHILTVLDTVTTPYVVKIEVPDEAIKTTGKILDEAKKKVMPYDYDVYTNYEKGKPAEEILKYVEDKDIGLIVIGNRGLGAFSRTFLGSISNKIINNSEISVLLVK